MRASQYSLIGTFILGCFSLTGCGDDTTSSTPAGGGSAGTVATGGSSGAGGSIGGVGGDALGGGGATGGGGAGGGSVNGGCLSPPTGTGLLISEIQIGQGVELFNPTDAPILLQSDVMMPPAYFLCAPYVYSGFGTPPTDHFMTTTIEPGNYLQLPWPDDYGELTMESGLLILYNDGEFFNSTGMVDVVCWGDISGNDEWMSRRDLEGAPWSGDCPPAPAGGVIHRVPGSSGEDAASYNTTAATSPMACP